MEYVNMSIGEVLKERRIELSIKQEDLAEQMGVTVQTVSKWERGITEPKASQVTKLSQALQLSEREICQGQKSKNNALDPYEFMRIVGPCMNDISETELIDSIYDHVIDQSSFINSIANKAKRPLYSFQQQEKQQVKNMMELYESGSIRFENEEEKERVIASWNQILNS
ncbi:helix-turn-helix domain-containing protein [Vibrio diazotrophicus]|uniref:Helix-turn-helix protein n=1 Tax=Vibrio diazotrophicus TaxID=685 RepID=A0A329DX42_VIBDI|nr:helix-turn-helix transcriptional regulator [Vibrio diazotrophicus]RAS55265.1 helix-turn-helix protein [Vibrio diazotrophicus]RAS55269.1 helix-turn-helix protein [Vibrio diazotrophicus]